MLAGRLRESRMPFSNFVQHLGNEFQLPTSVNPMFDQEACLLWLQLQVGVTDWTRNYRATSLRASWAGGPFRLKTAYKILS